MSKLIYTRIDKVKLHDRRSDTSQHDYTLEILGVADLGIFVLSIAHDKLALELHTYLNSLSPEQRLQCSGELKSRRSDNTTYWLISDFLRITLPKEDHSLVTYFKESSLQDEINQRYSKGDKIPLIFEFHSKLKIDGLLTKPSDNLLTICSIRRKNNGTLGIYLQSKLHSRYAYPLSVIPENSCKKIYLHPEYKPINQIQKGSIQSIDEFKKNILSFLEKNVRKQLLITFTDKVYIPGYSLVPTESIKVEVVLRDLSNNNGRTWFESINFFVKPKSRTFYYAEYFPFQVIESIEEYSIDNQPIYLTTSASKRPLKLTRKEELSEHGRISLFQLLASKNKSRREFNDTSCILCGRQLVAEDSYYVNLDIDGYLVNSLSTVDGSHFGFFKVGPECKKILSPDFLFTYHDICKSNHYKNIAIQQFNNR